MTAREAIRILMLSPIYFKIPPSCRIQLIKDYCILYSSDLNEASSTNKLSG